MKKVNTFWLILSALLIFIQTTSTAQIAGECTNCPVVFFDNEVDGIVTDEIEIGDQGVNDLGIAPLATVCVDVTHSWLGDLFLVLQSPAGKKYFLMGDDNNNAGGCGSAADNANVCFTIGSDNPLTNGSNYNDYCGTDPMACLSGDWNVSCGDAMISNLLPDASVAPNCDLNDFNEAGDPISGIWRLQLGCVCGAGENATLNDWSLSFTVPNFLACDGPTTTNATMEHQPCENDELRFTADAGVEYFWTGPNGYYNTTESISFSGFSDALAGMYSCMVVTNQECYEMHEIEVKNICQKSELTILAGESKNICVNELLSAGFVNEDTNNGFLEVAVNDNCLTVTSMSGGTDSIYLLQRVGEEDIYHRYIVEAMGVTSTNESFPINWQLSPNPTAGALHLRTPNVKPISITIVDLQGAMKRKVNPENGSTMLDLSNFANGVYIVRVKTEEGMFFQRVALMQ